MYRAKEVWKCCPLLAYQVTVTYNSSQNYVLLSSEKRILVLCEVMCQIDAENASHESKLPS